MSLYLRISKFLFFLCVFVCNQYSNAQTYEWQLANVVYSSTDPDGAGPATGTVQFTLQLRLASGVGAALTAISTGYSWQSANAMIPTTPACATVSAPANITLSAAFTAAGFAYNTVAQCVSTAQIVGGKTFDRTAAGTLETGSSINIGSTFTDVFTVTLWTLGTTGPAEGGFGILNSSDGAAVGALGSYALSDVDFNQYIANSLTYSTPLALGSGVVVPVTLKEFKAVCVNKGTLIKWSTASEQNNARFEVERSKDGLSFYPIKNVAGAGNSDMARNYEFTDLEGGEYYYRLKQVDFDGKYKYSDVVKMNCESKVPTSITLFPVPAHDKLNVIVKSDKSVGTTLVIFDAAGRIVRSQNVMVNNGLNTYSFDINSLPSGNYMIRSVDQQLQLNSKFTIAH